MIESEAQKQARLGAVKPAIVAPILRPGRSMLMRDDGLPLTGPLLVVLGGSFGTKVLNLYPRGGQAMLNFPMGTATADVTETKTVVVVTKYRQFRPANEEDERMLPV